MAMNTPRILGGGLAAGLVINVVDFISNTMLFKDRMGAELNAVAPGLMERSMTTSSIVQFVVVDFVLGILLVWLYAAIRPRFGPGPRTAAIAGLIQWLYGGLFYWVWIVLGRMST